MTCVIGWFEHLATLIGQVKLCIEGAQGFVGDLWKTVKAFGIFEFICAFCSGHCGLSLKTMQSASSAVDMTKTQHRTTL